MSEENAVGRWGIAYHTNSNSPRARKWYYVARLVKIDGKWFELYRESVAASCNRAGTRDDALAAGFELLRGVFRQAPAPRNGSVMLWSLDS